MSSSAEVNKLGEIIARMPDPSGLRAAMDWNEYLALAYHLFHAGVRPPEICDCCSYGNHADCRRFGGPIGCRCCDPQVTTNRPPETDEENADG